MLLWANDIEGSFWKAVDWLDICGSHSITLNHSKFVFVSASHATAVLPTSEEPNYLPTHLQEQHSLWSHLAWQETCQDCNRNAHLQPKAPSTPLTLPAYPFQYICANYFKHHRTNYLTNFYLTENLNLQQLIQESS